MNEVEFLWPEPGHAFFAFERTRPDAYSWMERSLGAYAHMYRRSAEQLIELACNAPGLVNAYAIPAVFVFRHYVELSLKDMLADAGLLNGLPGSFPDGHQLRPLWVALRPLLIDGQVSEADEELATLDVVESMLDELERHDPGSMSFRYPVDRESKGRRLLLSDDFEYFDMKVFREQARRLDGFIIGCSEKLAEYLHIKHDMDLENLWE